MNTIPTAKELFDKMISENDETTSTEMMIEFAKLHVEAALKEAEKSIKIGLSQKAKDLILNSYPLTNIK